MRIATWNLEWAIPGTSRHRRALGQLEAVDADIVVTTEDSLHDWAAYPHHVDGGPEWGYQIVEGRRKVIAWSRAPWTDVGHIDDGATCGRYVRAVTRVDDLEFNVLAVCIPWRDAHVRSGRGDQSPWAEHVEFCSVLLGEILDTACRGPTVVVGDFNQRIPRVRQPITVAEALTAAIGPLRVATSGEQEAGRLIDHVAHSSDLTTTHVDTWSNVIEGNRLSDHTGSAVTFTVAR